MIDNPLFENSYNKRMKRILVGGLLVFMVSYFVMVVLMYFAFKNQMDLEVALQELPEGEVTLEEVVPFPWESLYQFGPYTTVAEMEEITGIKSSYFQDIETDDIWLSYFIHQGQVVCSVGGYEGQLGFSIQLMEGSLFFGENRLFSVEHISGDYVRLKEIG